jgi:small basic protein
MTRAARSVYVFGIYLVGLGGVLIGSPNTLLTLVRLPTTTEPWIHVLGVAVLGMGMLFLASARAELTPFFRASVGVRLFAFATLVALALLNIAPPLVAAFGLADLSGAIWTFAALRKSVVGAPAV